MAAGVYILPDSKSEVFNGISIGNATFKTERGLYVNEDSSSCYFEYPLEKLFEESAVQSVKTFNRELGQFDFPNIPELVLPKIPTIYDVRIEIKFTKTTTLKITGEDVVYEPDIWHIIGIQKLRNIRLYPGNEFSIRKFEYCYNPEFEKVVILEKLEPYKEFDFNHLNVSYVPLHETQNRIYGQVRENGKPIPGAIVQYRVSGSSNIMSVTADNDGRYLIRTNGVTELKAHNSPGYHHITKNDVIPENFVATTGVVTTTSTRVESFINSLSKLVKVTGSYTIDETGITLERGARLEVNMGETCPSEIHFYAYPINPRPVENLLNVSIAEGHMFINSAPSPGHPTRCQIFPYIGRANRNFIFSTNLRPATESNNILTITAITATRIEFIVFNYIEQLKTSMNPPLYSDYGYVYNMYAINEVGYRFKLHETNFTPKLKFNRLYNTIDQYKMLPDKKLSSEGVVEGHNISRTSVWYDIPVTPGKIYIFHITGIESITEYDTPGEIEINRLQNGETITVFEATKPYLAICCRNISGSRKVYIDEL